jgi:hypothetical protein
MLLAKRMGPFLWMRLRRTVVIDEKTAHYHYLALCAYQLIEDWGGGEGYWDDSVTLCVREWSYFLCVHNSQLGVYITDERVHRLAIVTF